MPGLEMALSAFVSYGKGATYANATGKLVKKPNKMLARPDSAAVAVMRSCLTTTQRSGQKFWDVVTSIKGLGAHCMRRPATLPRLHICHLDQAVSRIHKDPQSPKEYSPEMQRVS